MARKEPESVIEVEGRQIKLSNLEKVLYPKAGLYQRPGNRLLRSHCSRAPCLILPIARLRSSAIPMALMACISTRKTVPATVRPG